MPDQPGYCTIQDVASVLQEEFRGSDPSPDHAKTAIIGESDWLRKVTKRHWFDPDHVVEPFGSGDVELSLPTEPIGVVEEAHDVPSSPHSQHGQLSDADDSRRYVKTYRGSYTRVTLDRRHATGIDALLVRRGDDYHDWMADPSRTKGRNGDYYIHADPHTGHSKLWLDSRGMTPAFDWGQAALVSYSYGDTPVPGSIRRAVALRAAAELATDEDANVQIPESAMVMSVDTKAQELRDMADQKLKPYRSTAVA